MRNAALVLGLIGGLIGMLVGFFSYGYIEAIERYGEIDGIAEQVSNVGLIRATKAFRDYFETYPAALK